MRNLIKIVVLVLILDALVVALPAAYSLAQGDQYLPFDEQGPVLNFFRSLGFHSIVYLMMASPIHVVSAAIYVALIKQTKENISVCIGLGIFISLGIYLLYAYKYSVDWSLDYFHLRIIWYSCLGALFGALYFKIAEMKRITNEI